MKKIITVVLLGLAVTGCAQSGPKSASSSQAIQSSESMQTTEQKVNYLVTEAKAFISSEKYQEAVTIAQHILTKLDQNSQEAKNVLAEAQEKLKAMAMKAMDDAKATTDKTMSDMKSKLGNLGK